MDNNQNDMKEKVTTASLTKRALDKLNAIRGVYFIQGTNRPQTVVLEMAINMLFDAVCNKPFTVRPEDANDETIVSVRMEDLVQQMEDADEQAKLGDLRERAAEVFNMPVEDVYVEETMEPGKYEVSMGNEAARSINVLNWSDIKKITASNVVVDGSITTIDFTKDAPAQ